VCKFETSIVLLEGRWLTSIKLGYDARAGACEPMGEIFEQQGGAAE
jgi:hypothetical protein